MVLWNFNLLWKKYAFMDTNYGTMDKTIVLLGKKLWYYTENYGSDYQKLRNFDL